MRGNVNIISTELGKDEGKVVFSTSCSNNPCSMMIVEGDVTYRRKEGIDPETGEPSVYWKDAKSPIKLLRNWECLDLDRQGSHESLVVGLFVELQRRHSDDPVMQKIATVKTAKNLLVGCCRKCLKEAVCQYLGTKL